MARTVSGRRALSAALAGAAAIAYALVALASGLDRMGSENPVLAGMLPSGMAAQALRNQATNAQSIGDADRALELAQAAVRRTPIEPSSTAVLGAALLARQNDAASEQAFRVAAQMGWRVPLTQLYWMQASLAYDDYSNAALRLDALLRQQPELLRNRKLLDPLEGNEAGRTALAARLAEQPGWLKPYIDDVWNVEPGVLELRRLVLLDLARQGKSLQCEQISQFIQREIDLGNFRAAHEVWTAHCPDARGTIIYDGTFAKAQIAQTRASLAWTFVGNAGISLLLEPGRRPGTQLLVVDGMVQLPKVFVRQLVLLRPGDYRVGWTATMESGAASSRVVAGLDCGGQIAWQSGTAGPDGRRSALLHHDGTCEAPWLSFALVPGEGATQISDVTLVPAKAR